jgi:prophage regulatory protein
MLLVSAKRLQSVISISRATAYRLMRSGAFPRPVRLSPGRVAWRLVDLERWAEQRSV